MGRVVFTVFMMGSAAVVEGQQAAYSAGTPGGTGTVTLTGCVTRGVKGNSYVVSSLTPVRTSGGLQADANAVYWLDSPDHVKGYVGEQVEIQGAFFEEARVTRISSGNDDVRIAAQQGPAVRVRHHTPAATHAALGGAERRTYRVLVTSVRKTGGSCS